MHKGHYYYITGASDNNVCVWNVPPETLEKEHRGEVEEGDDISNDVFISTLRDFVSYKTISSRTEFTEDCHKGATFLGNLFKGLGGQVEMLTTGDKSHNPVVLSTFSGKLEPVEKRKRILFYGHYDVVAADAKRGNWHSEPFDLQGRDGYLYGRGVSDNKGPIVAALFAVTDLVSAKLLDNDVVFLIEGEEEFGSRSFQETVQKNKELIGHIDYVVLANSYWFDDDVPCLTYGLRGVLHATACVDSDHPDLHSGMNGSSLENEPLSDLTSIMAQLKGPKNKIMLPDFYDDILPSTAEEEARFDEIVAIRMRKRPYDGPVKKQKGLLHALLREPNLTIHRYRVSGGEGSLVSSHASAAISFRLVPGQEVEDVIRSLTCFLEEKFAELESGNTFSLKINNVAEPWLGDTSNAVFRTLEGAVMEAWKDAFESEAGKAGKRRSVGNGTGSSKPKRPLYIREGGSIPAIRFLEKEFGAPAAHLPCGQSSDSAHLDNERLRIVNLLKAREIFGKVFARL